MAHSKNRMNDTWEEQMKQKSFKLEVKYPAAFKEEKQETVACSGPPPPNRLFIIKSHCHVYLNTQYTVIATIVILKLFKSSILSFHVLYFNVFFI